MKSKQKAHYEIVSAKIYYGKHATGVVLLRNGCVEFHGEKADAEKILKSQKESDEKCF